MRNMIYFDVVSGARIWPDGPSDKGRFFLEYTVARLEYI